MRKPTYTAYSSVDGRILGSSLDGWTHLAQGVCDSHAGEPFTIRHRNGVRVYLYAPVACLRVRVNAACDDIEAEARQAEGATA